LATITGSNVPSRSRGTCTCTSPALSVNTVFVRVPLRELPPLRPSTARPGPTSRDNVAVHAVARIMLHGQVPNIQTSWIKRGVEGTRTMLRSGANDLGGTLMEETISRIAGSEHGSAKTIAELTDIAAGINRPIHERTTTYAEARM
jgi:FO synthase